MPKIVSYPGAYKLSQAEQVAYQDKDQPFGYFEMQNYPLRPTQEDALAWETLDYSLDSLSPDDIGKRLWTTYQTLDEQILKYPYSDGTTASTTVYDGKGNLITGTLADAASFAAIYDREGKVLGVVRLNSVTHKPTDPGEKQRIQEAGGRVILGRVEGRLAISRAIGDKPFKEHGVCSEATIDITSIDDLAKQLNISSKAIGKVQIITTCDGFTDGAKEDTKKGHEEFLHEALKEIVRSNKNKPETTIAKALVDKAKKNGSKDNISVVIQTINEATPAFLLGVYDGHGGPRASTYVAKNIGTEFKKQCSLKAKVYEGQKKNTYNRANKDKIQPADKKTRVTVNTGIQKTIRDKEFTNLYDYLVHFAQENKKLRISVTRNESTVTTFNLLSTGATVRFGDQEPSSENLKPFNTLIFRTGDSGPNLASIKFSNEQFEVKFNEEAAAYSSNYPSHKEKIINFCAQLNIILKSHPENKSRVCMDSLQQPPNQEYDSLVRQLRLLTREYKNQLSRKNQEIHSIVDELLLTLEPSEKNNAIEKFYNVLDRKKDGNAFTNMDIIQNNKDYSTKHFIAGIKAIFASLVTRIFPGIGRSEASGQPLGNVFKTPSDAFKDNLAKIREQYQSNPKEKPTPK